MKTLPQFEVFEDDQSKTGCFSWDSSDSTVDELYMDAEDHYFELEHDKARKQLQKVIQQNPLYIDAYILLSSIATTEERYEEAENELGKAIRIWESAIPEDYEGQIPWGFTENRPYLTLLFELSDLYDSIGKTDEAVELSEKILSYNPTDNQGVRWSLGNLYLKSDRLDEAEKYLKKYANEYPPNRYSYAFLLWKKDRRWDAVTQFRLAFIENIYIYEHLTFKAPLVPYDIIESTNLHGIHGAVNYLETMGDFWMNNEKAIWFMNSLKTHPVVITELNEIFNIKHDLNHFSSYIPLIEEEDEFNDMDLENEHRQELVDEIEAIKKRITSTSSRKIVKELGDFLE